MAATNEALEDAADDDPARELHTGRWREEHGGAEGSGDVDVAPPRVRVTASENVEGDGEERKDKNDIKEAVVSMTRLVSDLLEWNDEGYAQLSGAKELVGTNSSPDSGRRDEELLGRAGEAVGRQGRTCVDVVVEDRVSDALRDEHRQCASNDLSDKHKARRDLHVVAELETREEVGGHLGRPAEVRLEQDEGNGLSRRDVATQKLGQVVEGEPLVGNGANDAEGNDEAHGEENGNHEGPNGESSGEDLDTDARGDEAEDEEEAVPPHRHLGVRQHETVVYVAALLPRHAELTDDIATVPN